MKLEPAALLAWLLGLGWSAFAFIRWVDARWLPFPANPDRICDTLAHLERLDDNHIPSAVVIEFNIDPDRFMFGRMMAYLGLSNQSGRSIACHSSQMGQLRKFRGQENFFNDATDKSRANRAP